MYRTPMARALLLAVYHSTNAAPAFEAMSGAASGDAGTIRVSGSHVDGLLTSIVSGGHRDGGVSITLPAAPLSMWRRGKMLRPGAGLTAAAHAASSSGVDAFLGPFEELSQAWLCAGEENDGPCLTTSVRILQSRPAVVWRQEWPLGTSGAPSLGTVNAALCTFPAFAGGEANSTSGPRRLGNLGFTAWTGEFAVTPAWRAGVWAADYGRWEGDWGMYSSALSLFDTTGRTLVLGPLSGFTSSVNALYNGSGLAAGPHGMVEELPAGFSLDTVMTLGPGIVGTQMDYGSILLGTHGKQRTLPDVSPAVSSLMYSADAYPYYDPPSGNSTCGNYEDLYIALAKANRAQRLPYRTSMLDSFWYGQAVHGGVWTWDAASPCFTSRFPRGLPWLRQQMGIDFVAHLGTWLKDGPYTRQYSFVDDPQSMFALPTEQSFWDDLFANATRGPHGWGLSVMKQDHQDQQIGCDWNHGSPACHRWAGTVEPAVLSNWLAQMASGAAANGVTIEYGTTISRFVLNTATLPAVTHARGANDYCVRAVNDSWRVGPAAAFFWSVGLYTTKDTFFSSSNETTAHGDFNGYYERHPELHAAVSALSAGPVSPSDAPGGGNVSLIMRTCRSDGTLLKPDAPAMPLDAFWLGSAFCGGRKGKGCPVAAPAPGELWATATRIGSTMVWPLVFAQLTADFGLELAGVFSHLRGVPSMHRDGSVAPAGWQPPARGWVLFRPGAPLDRQPPRLIACNATLKLTAGATYGDFTLHALSPIVMAAGGGPDWALLGETDKFVPISRQRILGITTDASQLRVAVAGAAREVVTLRAALVARDSASVGPQVVERTVTLGRDGRGAATFGIGAT